MSYEKTSGFHWGHGHYFERLADGSVEMRFPGIEHQQFRTIPANEWASIVAAVSARGENGATYYHALGFHNASTHLVPAAPEEQTK